MVKTTQVEEFIEDEENREDDVKVLELTEKIGHESNNNDNDNDNEHTTFDNNNNRDNNENETETKKKSNSHSPENANQTTQIQIKKHKQKKNQFLSNSKKQIDFRQYEVVKRSLKYAKYVNGTMPEWSNFTEKYFFLDFIDYTFRGAAQVVFMNNPITGILIVIGLFVASWWTAICGMIGLMSSTLMALLIGVNKGLIRAGLYGYNGILVGLALGTFLDHNFDLNPNPNSNSEANVLNINENYKGIGVYAPLIASCICGGFSTILTVAIANLLSPKYGLPAFTLPFNFMTIFFLLGCYNFEYFKLSAPSPSIILVANNPFSFHPKQIFPAILTGIGQVYLAGSPVSGGLMLVGTAVCSRVSAIFMALGSFIGILTAFLLGANIQEIEFGLWSYNAVLGTMAVGGIFFILSVKSTILAVLCGVLCTIILGTTKSFFKTWGVPSLTFPFCTGAILFLLMRGSISGTHILELGSITTPEGNYKAHKAQVQVASESFV